MACPRCACLLALLCFEARWSRNLTFEGQTSRRMKSRLPSRIRSAPIMSIIPTRCYSHSFFPSLSRNTNAETPPPCVDHALRKQFGGPIGVTAMMLIFPPLMYYLWTCLVFYDGKLVGPKSLSIDDIKGFVYTFFSIAKTASWLSYAVC